MDYETDNEKISAEILVKVNIDHSYTVQETVRRMLYAETPDPLVMWDLCLSLWHSIFNDNDKTRE